MIKAFGASSSLTQVQRLALRQTYLLALLLLLITIIVNYILQPTFFRPRVFNGNLQAYIPLMLLAAGQAIVIIGGGVDLSIGTIVSVSNVVMMRLIGGPTASPSQIALAIGVGILCGLLAGALNGFCVAYLRFQPIVTTFASTSIFSGLALWVLPKADGNIPTSLSSSYSASIYGISTALLIALVLVVAWTLLRNTRYGSYLFAVGGQPISAYITGVPVNLIRFSTYVLAGFMAALSALTLVISTGGDPLVGPPMTLSSIVAVVLGGTRLRGGQGGVLGSILGVILLGFIRSIISAANIPAEWQTLVDSLIILLALIGPGIVSFVRRQRP